MQGEGRDDDSKGAQQGGTTRARGKDGRRGRKGGKGSAKEKFSALSMSSARFSCSLRRQPPPHLRTHNTTTNKLVRVIHTRRRKAWSSHCPRTCRALSYDPAGYTQAPRENGACASFSLQLL